MSTGTFLLVVGVAAVAYYLYQRNQSTKAATKAFQDWAAAEQARQVAIEQETAAAFMGLSADLWRKP